MAHPMSDILQHECGIALLRLKQPLQHYIDRYGTAGGATETLTRR